MIGAYVPVDPLAYPGWRLTIPGGPAGGHYKGFTHAYGEGTSIAPSDQYEQDRADGVASHDAVHASPRSPRGVYRGPAEVPPRPNASGSAHVLDTFQTQRHAGTSVSPGSFPVEFTESPEDFFIDEYGDPQLGIAYANGNGGGRYGYGRSAVPARPYIAPAARANVVSATPAAAPYTPAISPAAAQYMQQWGRPAPVAAPVPFYAGAGATSTVAQPSATPIPQPPAPTVLNLSPPPLSPQPSPVVATNTLVPANNGTGNYINASTGATVPASQVVMGQNGQAQLAPGGTFDFSGVSSWLDQQSIITGYKNLYVVGGGLLALMLLKGGKHR